MAHLVLTAPMVRAWLENSAEVLAEKREYLTELDGPIGDSDHGNNMDRGFAAVTANLPDSDDLGEIFKKAAMTLISTVGGAAGPLYGTFFLDASKVLAGHTSCEGGLLADALEAGVNGVKKRGKSDVGMATMLDALVPAAETFRDYVDEGGTILAALSAAASAAEEGMRATIPMQAQRGRASYLGERSIGHQDPGATSSQLILQAFAEAVSAT